MRWWLYSEIIRWRWHTTPMAQITMYFILGLGHGFRSTLHLHLCFELLNHANIVSTHFLQRAPLDNIVVFNTTKRRTIQSAGPMSLRKRHSRGHICMSSLFRYTRNKNETKKFKAQLSHPETKLHRFQSVHVEVDGIKTHSLPCKQNETTQRPLVPRTENS